MLSLMHLQDKTNQAGLFSFKNSKFFVLTMSLELKLDFSFYGRNVLSRHKNGTMTEIYQSTGPSSTYWTGPKFLSRSKWRIDEVISVLIQHVQKEYSKGVYVYDETHSTNNGRHQYGTHFFKDTRSNKRNKNQSKFHHGH